MKKNILIIVIFLITFFIFLFFAPTIKEETLEFNNLFFYTYIPCLIPFLIINSFFINIIDFNLIYSIFKSKSKIFFDIIIIVLIVIIGTPSSSLILRKLENSNIYSKEKIQSILINYSTISLPFIYSISNKNILFIFLLIVVNTISYFITNFQLDKDQKSKDFKNKSILENIFVPLKNIYLFSYLSMLIHTLLKQFLPTHFSLMLISFLESTYSCIKLINTDYQFIIFFILSFTSFNIVYLSNKIITICSFKKYIKRRLFIASFVTLLMIIFYWSN
jgi:hypothetical protein